MKVIVQSQNKEVNLPTHYISGGEGDVYLKDGYAYKIYHDTKKALSEKKFNELKKLDRTNIIKPESLLLDKSGIIIGYMMKAAPKGFSLSRLITNDFRNQHNINNDMILNLIQKIRDTFEFIHSKGCLVVDGNEMNYLVSENFEDVYFIDVDSYQTPSFVANAYSPSTIDPLINKTAKFSTNSDWFIFAIISCNLLLGIHPFKGAYKGFSLDIKKGDIKKRMEFNRSIFNKNVSVNSAVRDFSIIPAHYREWFLTLFEKGQREPAPVNIFDIKIDSKKFIKNTIFNGKIKSSTLYSYSKNIQALIQSDNYTFIKANKEFIDIKNIKSYKIKDINSFFIEINNTPYFIKLDKSLVLFNTLTSIKIETHIFAENLFIIDNRIYTTYNNKINEYKYFSEKLLLVNSWDILENSSEVFTNIIIQRLSKRNILYIPFESGSCSIINMKELEFKKIVNAYYANHMIELVSYENGKYKRMIIKLEVNMKDYSIILDEDTESVSINCTTLLNGIFISIFNDKELYITSNKTNKNNINIVKDNNIEINHKLHSHKNDVYMIMENKINKISLN